MSHLQAWQRLFEAGTRGVEIATGVDMASSKHTQGGAIQSSKQARKQGDKLRGKQRAQRGRPGGGQGQRGGTPAATEGEALPGGGPLSRLQRWWVLEGKALPGGGSDPLSRLERWWHRLPAVRTLVGWQRLKALPPAPFPIQYILDYHVFPAWLGTGNKGLRNLIIHLPNIGDWILEAEMLQVRARVRVNVRVRVRLDPRGRNITR